MSLTFYTHPITMSDGVKIVMQLFYKTMILLRKQATIFVAVIAVSAAHADTHDTDEVILARIAVHESGWSSPADVALIHDVIIGIVERDHVSYRRAAELAAPRLAACCVRRRWVCGLSASASRPRYWAGASWAAHRDRWLGTVDTARSVIEGTIPSPCRDRPRVWGSPADVARGRRRGHVWVDAGCLGTRNLGGRWR